MNTLFSAFSKTAPSVSKILETFHTVVAQLEDAAEAHRKLAEDHAEAARVALQQEAASKAEVEAATTAVQNIRALIGS